MSIFEFEDEAKFLRQERQRLSRARDMPPWRGPWAAALDAELKQRRLLPDDPPYTLVDVVNCFCDHPRQRVEELFHVLTKACSAAPPADETAMHWATELTCLAAARTLNLEQWSQMSCTAGRDESPRALAAQVATSSSLVAAIAISRLLGLDLSWNPKEPTSLIDLSALLHESCDPVSAVLSALADELDRLEGKSQHPQPGRRLSADEVGQLRDRFDTYRLDGKLVGVYAQPDGGLTPEKVMAVLGDVAHELNATTVGGEKEHGSGLVHRDSQITVASLKAKLEKIFLTFVQSQSGAGHTAPAPADSSAQTAGASPEIFISHASEDKADFVNDLVRALKSEGVRLWYDNDQILPGDSVSGKIREGLRQSRYGLLVLSPNSLTKGRWVDTEWNSLLNEEISTGVKRVIPVRWKASLDDVRRVSIDLADKLTIDGSRPLPDVVAEILKVIRPQ